MALRDVDKQMADVTVSAMMVASFRHVIECGPLSGNMIYLVPVRRSGMTTLSCIMEIHGNQSVPDAKCTI